MTAAPRPCHAASCADHGVVQVEDLRRELDRRKVQPLPKAKKAQLVDTLWQHLQLEPSSTAPSSNATDASHLEDAASAELTASGSQATARGAPAASRGAEQVGSTDEMASGKQDSPAVPGHDRERLEQLYAESATAAGRADAGATTGAVTHSPAQEQMHEAAETERDEHDTGSAAHSPAGARLCTEPDKFRNQLALPMWVLGTSSAAAGAGARAAALAVRCHNDVWLFDCGDDTQRQVMATTADGGFAMRYLMTTQIFITALDGPRAHGLPGLLCTLARARARASRDAQQSACVLYGGQEGARGEAGLDAAPRHGVHPILSAMFACGRSVHRRHVSTNERVPHQSHCHMQAAAKGHLQHNTTPVNVHGPPGLADFVNAMLTVSDTFLAMPVCFFELVDGPVAPEEYSTPQCLNRRAKLYRVRRLGCALRCSVLLLLCITAHAPSLLDCVAQRAQAYCNLMRAFWWPLMRADAARRCACQLTDTTQTATRTRQSTPASLRTHTGMHSMSHPRAGGPGCGCSAATTAAAGGRSSCPVLATRKRTRCLHTSSRGRWTAATAGRHGLAIQKQTYSANLRTGAHKAVLTAMRTILSRQRTPVKCHSGACPCGAVVDMQVVACAGLGERPSFSYVATEPDRVGALQVDKCVALGVGKDWRYKRLKEGVAVVSDGGEEVLPEQARATPRMFEEPCYDDSVRHSVQRSVRLCAFCCQHRV
jgi:hypothetical protein